MLLGLLLVIQIVVCIALVGVILLQRSEGGALGMGGGGAGGFMTARGAGDLLTRTTAILATIFFILSIVLTIVSGKERGGASVVDRLKVDALNPDALRPAQPATPAQPLPAQPGAPGAPAGPSVPNVFEAPRPEVNTAPGATPNAPPPGQIFNVPAPAQPAPQPASKQ
jgi:preprotein translocase subunit SecG